MSDPYAAAVSGAAGRSLQLDQILATLLRQAPDVEAAAVVSFDGLPMASALPAGMDEDRVAAMSAALLSLGERAAQGLGRGDLSQVYVEGDNGTVFLVSADDEAVLVAVGRKGAKVGLMLFEVKQAADAVGAALRIEAAPVEPLVPQIAPVAEPVAVNPAEAPVAPVEQAAGPVAEQVVEAPAQPVAEPVAEPVADPVAEPVAEHATAQPVPTVVPDPPVSDEPHRQPVAVPVPREVRESPWDHPSQNGSNGEQQRRPATVAPDGSGWS
jgi:predicted regulator of Ras-like GTPase activity (Roadblock/LC7/MglB family)